MDELIAQLQGKLKVFALTFAKTDTIIAKDDAEISKRQRNSLTTMVNPVTAAKEGIEEQKFLKVAQWGVPIEQVVTEADASVQKLTAQIKEINSAAEAAEKAKKRKAQLEFEQAQYVLQQTHENHERACQIEQEERLLQQKLRYQQMLDEAHPEQPKDVTSIAAKLPKLSITKFNGSFSDWLRFWNQFQAVVDSQSINKVTKFAYLKELLEPNVRTSIDGLPFTEDGYGNPKKYFWKSMVTIVRLSTPTSKKLSPCQRSMVRNRIKSIRFSRNYGTLYSLWKH